MKKAILILFIVIQFLNSNTSIIQNQNIHVHSEEISGVTYIYEHSHSESQTTLFYEIKKEKPTTSFLKEKSPKYIKLLSNLIENSIFRPPIS